MSLEYFEGKNAGGLAEIHLIKQSSATFPDPAAIITDLDYTEDITTSENWTQHKFVPNSGRFEEGAPRENGSEVYEYTIEYVINKDRQAITAALKDLKPYKLLALIKDNNATYRLIGSDVHHCILTYSQVKERGIAVPNLYRITLTCRMHHPAVYYSGNFTSS